MTVEEEIGTVFRPLLFRLKADKRTVPNSLDGVLEGLDNRKKTLFMQMVRDYCQRYGLQYIFSSIEDDIPQNILSSFTADEMFLTLSDQDDSSKLFGFSF